MPEKPSRDIKELSLIRPELKALYARIGGEAGLEKILTEFYERMSTDLLIGFFFEAKDIRAIALKQKDFLMRAMGARASYTGQPPALAHLELAPILAGHFDRRLRILEDVLKKNAVSEEDIRTWIRFESAFRDGVQRAP